MVAAGSRLIVVTPVRQTVFCSGLIAAPVLADAEQQVPELLFPG